MRCVNKATAFTSGEVCEADLAPIRKNDYQTFASKVAHEHVWLAIRCEAKFKDFQRWRLASQETPPIRV